MNIFIEDLLTAQFEAYDIRDSSIKLNINIDSIVLDTKVAVIIGCILNEAVTNSIKYY